MENKIKENQILQNFYHRTLPLYTPQAEKLLDTVQPESLKQVAFRYAFSVEAMTKISHIIEDTAIASRGVADLHVSFQYLSRLQPQKARYRTISQNVKGLWLYGATTVAEPEVDFGARTVVIDTTDTLLMNYWYVVAYGPGVGMALLAEEVPSLVGSDRYYEGFYTFEQDMAYQLIAILHRIYPNSVPQPTPPEQFDMS